MLWKYVFTGFFLVTMGIGVAATRGSAAEDRAKFPANPECRVGKKIVLIPGDEEYRSEEYLTALAKILATRHGFDTVVLYPLDPAGKINPLILDNIPGLEELRDADAMITALRFRNLPDDQMAEFDTFLRRGGPVLGLRTATHGFNIPTDRAFARYSYGYAGDDFPDWKEGFGRKILGETWINHHGHHGVEATRSAVAPGKENHPILRSVEPIFAPTDVYTVRLPLPDNAEVLLLGEVLDGMTAESQPVENEKNDPKMPVVWLKSYQIEGGATGKSLTSTIGAAVDFSDESFRRLLVNGTYWLTGLRDRIPMRADVDFVGEYHPSWFGYGKFVPDQTPDDMEK